MPERVDASQNCYECMTQFQKTNRPLCEGPGRTACAVAAARTQAYTRLVTTKQLSPRVIRKVGGHIEDNCPHKKCDHSNHH